MDKKNPSIAEQTAQVIDLSSGNEPGSKKAFVEPEISVPVDVLEATTFFQVTTSGATN